MITKTTPSLHCLNGKSGENNADGQQARTVKRDWQTALSEAIRDPRELLTQLKLPVSLLEQSSLSPTFPLRVTQSFIRRMQPGNPLDPLLLQVLPLNQELKDTDWGSLDPVCDQHAMQGPGLLHKYQGRVLLVSTAACAIHCRYCFRQHFPYQQANPLGSQLPATLAYLNAHQDIHEVILSGGDPLSLSDERLSRIVEQLDQIPHLKTLRIHTRLPLVLPERIDANLLKWLQATRLKVVLVLHINHPNEIDQEFAESIAHLQLPGVSLLNQSVLLRGINDSAEILVSLSHMLFEVGILPYYLHQLDKVQGAAHFEVPAETGVKLLAEMRHKLPGYLVPKYVKEIPGEPAKYPIFG